MNPRRGIPMYEGARIALLTPHGKERVPGPMRNWSGPSRRLSPSPNPVACSWKTTCGRTKTLRAWQPLRKRGAISFKRCSPFAPTAGVPDSVCFASYRAFPAPTAGSQPTSLSPTSWGAPSALYDKRAQGWEPHAPTPSTAASAIHEHDRGESPMTKDEVKVDFQRKDRVGREKAILSPGYSREHLEKILWSGEMTPPAARPATSRPRRQADDSCAPHRRQEAEETSVRAPVFHELRSPVKPVESIGLCLMLDPCPLSLSLRSQGRGRPARSVC
jgi:hypothetical protein